jgi:tRNA-specific 2-thiouridylase
MRVAARLRIPFHTLDASAEYKQYVIDYLLAEYAAGRTPNPDVMCNREVKFGVFYRYARALGADAIATGHYLSGEKDQRYFLWAVPAEVLMHTIFPVGEMDKRAVRRLAQKYRLPVADKKDSQGVCFLGNISVKEFLERELRTSNPALLHTIGERIEGKYVVGKDVVAGRLTLAESRASAATSVALDRTVWHRAPEEVVEAQYRYRGPRIAGRLEGAHFLAYEPLPEVPTPGQSIVFYTADGVLAGGGIIGG